MKTFRTPLAVYGWMVFVLLGTGFLLAWRLFPGEEAPFWVRFSMLLLFLALGIATTLLIYHRQETLNLRNQLYQTLQVLEQFDVDDPEPATFKPSAIPILNEIHEYLQTLINRIQDHYQANKQFTQNASHELQTPLAVIKGQVELLLQSPLLSEKEIEALGIILHHTKRLAKLNSALILLSKIEHHRFIDYQEVSIQHTMEEVLLHFRDLIRLQQLDIRKDYREDTLVRMSETLAEILLANLIQNAIRHNKKEEGYISIRIENNLLQITNPGKILGEPPETLFKRFVRRSDSEESLGLGLSIVDRICNLYGFQVRYVHDHGLHTLEICF